MPVKAWDAPFKTRLFSLAVYFLCIHWRTACWGDITGMYVTFVCGNLALQSPVLEFLRVWKIGIYLSRCAAVSSVSPLWWLMALRITDLIKHKPSCMCVVCLRLPSLVVKVEPITARIARDEREVKLLEAGDQGCVSQQSLGPIDCWIVQMKDKDSKLRTRFGAGYRFLTLLKWLLCKTLHCQVGVPRPAHSRARGEDLSGRWQACMRCCSVGQFLESQG